MSNDKNLTVDQTFNLAVQNHQNNNLQDAQNYYQKVLGLDPNHSQTLNNLGILFQGLGENQKAIGCYKKVISINPNYVDAHNNLGAIFKELGEIERAKECYKKVIKIDPNFAHAHNNLGVIYQDLGKLQKARKCYEKAIEIDHNYLGAHNNLAVLFKELKEFEKAKGCYEKAIAINSDYADAHNNLGIIFKKLGQNQKAKTCFEKAISIDPNYANAHNNLGKIFKEFGEFDKAIDCYEKAIKINPNYALAQVNLKFLLDKQRLLSEIEKAKKSKNNNKINFIKKICKKIFGTNLRLKTNPFISYRAVEEDLISCIYKLNNKSFKETNNVFFGNGKHSEDFMIFQKNFSILKKVENELTVIMKEAVKSDIFICDSFFNILRDSNEGGSKWHIHVDNWDISHGLQKQKYSLTYHVAIGNQKSSKPGFLSFKDPDEEILPSEGMVMIFPADRSHSAIYDGEIDRVMIGVNFYSLI